MTGRIFINYRRGDSQAAAGRLYDRLLQHFDRDRLFMDVDGLEPGVDFEKSLDEQVSNCSAFISVIGPGWLRAKDSDGSARLDNPNDYVRVEIESALKRDIRVIPVLVDGASMPRPSDLPSPIESLARRNAVELAHHRFAADCDELAQSIKRLLGVEAQQPAIVQALPTTTPVPDFAHRRLSWAEMLFSFKGRISRLQYLIGTVGYVIVLLTLGLTIESLVHGIFGGFDNPPPELQQKLRLFDKYLGLTVQVLSLWPNWALTLKRLHDIGHGWRTLLIFAAFDLAGPALRLFEKIELADQLNLVAIGISLMLAAIKGSPGPSGFGADPLV